MRSCGVESDGRGCVSDPAPETWPGPRLTVRAGAGCSFLAEGGVAEPQRLVRAVQVERVGAEEVQERKRMVEAQ